MIHLIVGLPGCGKTTTANYLLGEIKGISINSDEVFKCLFPGKLVHPGRDYNPDQLHAIYQKIPTLLKDILEANQSVPHVVVDGCFRFNEHRNGVLNMASHFNQICSIVHVTAPIPEIEKRLRKRLRNFPNADGTQILEKVQDDFEVPEKRHVLDNSGTISDLYRNIDLYLNALSIPPS